MVEVDGLDSKTAAVHIVREMGRKLMCPLCRNLLKDAHTLPCQHHFCGDCLEELPDYVTTCPECSVPFWLKERKHNLALVNIVDAYRKLRQATGALTPQEQINVHAKRKRTTGKIALSVGATCNNGGRREKAGTGQPSENISPKRRRQDENTDTRSDVDRGPDTAASSTINSTPVVAVSDPSLQNTRAMLNALERELATVPDSQLPSQLGPDWVCTPEVAAPQDGAPAFDALAPESLSVTPCSSREAYPIVEQVYQSLHHAPAQPLTAEPHTSGPQRNVHFRLKAPAPSSGLAAESSVSSQQAEARETSTASPTANRDISAPKMPIIVCTGVKGPALRQMKATVKSLGGLIVKEMAARVTHVITPTVGQVREVQARTLKILQGMASGKWIVSYDWVIESQRAGRWLPVEDFEAKGPESARDAPQQARTCRRRTGRALLDEWHLTLVGETSEGEPSAAQVQQLVQDLGGTFVSWDSVKKMLQQDSEDIPVVLLPMRLWGSSNPPELEMVRQAQEKRTISCVSIGWLLDSLQIHKLYELGNPKYKYTGFLGDGDEICKDEYERQESF
eukprot:g1465.t1